MRTEPLSRSAYAAVLIAILCASAFVQTRGLNRPWGNYRDANGFSQGTIAENYGKYGLTSNRLALLFAQSPRKEMDGVFRLKFGDNPYFIMKSNRVILAHYPPAMNLALYAVYRVFGSSHAVTRLFFIAFTMLGLIMFALAARWAAGGVASLIAVFFLSLSPMVLAYGQMADTIVLSQPFITGAVFSYCLWNEKRTRLRLAALLFFIIAGCSIGWYAYMAVPILWLHHIFYRKGRFSLPLFLLLPLVSGACLAAFVFWLIWAIGPHSVHDWLNAFSTRSGDFILINGVRHPITAFQYVKTIFLRIPFHFTWPVFAAVLVWLAGLKSRPSWKPSGNNIPFTPLLLLSGATPILLLKQGVYVHGFFLYLAGPAVCLFAAIAFTTWLKSGGAAAAAACVLACAVFVVSVPPRYSQLTHYLKIDTLDEFAKFAESVSGKDTVIAQDVYDFGMVEWLKNYSDRFVLQRELDLAQIKKAISMLPSDSRMIFIHTPMPDTYRMAHTESVLAWLYKNYGYYEKGKYVVFDTTLKPARGDNSGIKPGIETNLIFQNNIELTGVDARINGANAVAPGGGLKNSRIRVTSGGKVEITFHWKCLRPVSNDFFILVNIIPGLLHADHEPVKGVYLTSKWKPGDIVRESVVVDAPEYIKPGVYPVNIALCAKSEPQAFCLMPQNLWASPQPKTFTKIAELEIVRPAGVAEEGRKYRAADPLIASKLADDSAYLEYNDLRSYESFMKYLGMDAIFGSSFKGWTYLFLGDTDEALPILEGLSSRLDSFGMIEKMVPTAMQEVPALLKVKLMSIYLEQSKFVALARQAVSLAFNIPVSYPIYMRVGGQMDKKATENKAAAVVIGTFADYFYNRASRMMPGDNDTMIQVAQHYIATGRPDKAFSVAGGMLGARSNRDIRINALFAAEALREGRTDDYILAKARLKAMNASVDLDTAIFENIMKTRERNLLFAFLDQQAPAAQSHYLCESMDAYFYTRDFASAEAMTDRYLDMITGESPARRKMIASYLDMLAFNIYAGGYEKKAISYYSQSLKNAPSDSTALFNLSQLYNSDGRRDKALELITKLLKITPGDAAAVQFKKRLEAK